MSETSCFPRSLSLTGPGNGHRGANFRDNEVTAGIGEIVAITGGGTQTASLWRFLRPSIVVGVGDTVEWTNLELLVSHTVTFGTEPTDLLSPSANVTVDSDGARHAVISSPTDNVHSGNLARSFFQERVGLAQSPLGVTRFRVTFTVPGTFNYICALHDDVGMVGRVIVRPGGHRDDDRDE